MDYPDLVNDRAEADTFGPGKNGFTEGTGAPLTRSLIRATSGNAWTREILKAIEDSGQTPSAANLEQLSEAIILQAEQRGEQAAKQYSALTALAQASGGSVSTSSMYTSVPNHYQAGSFQAAIAGVGGVLFTVTSTGAGTVRTAGANDFRCGATNTAKGVASGVVLFAGASGGIRTCPYNGAATWTARTAAASYAGTFRGATYASSKFLLCGDSTEAQTSPDGTTWTRSTTAAGFTDDFLCATYHAGLFIIGGEQNELQTSATANTGTWTRRTLGGVSSHVISLVSFGSYVVALKASGEIRYSLDGITWTAASDTAPVAVANALFVDRDRLYALGRTGAAYGNVAVCTDIVRSNWRLANLGLNSSNEPADIYTAFAFGPDKDADAKHSRLYLAGNSGGTGEHVTTPAFA